MLFGDTEYYRESLVKVTVDSHYFGAVNDSLRQFAQGYITLGDDNDAAETAVSGVRRRRGAGITGGSTDNSLAALFNRFSHRHHHAPVFKRTGRMAPFQFEVKFTAAISLRQLIAAD